MNFYKKILNKETILIAEIAQAHDGSLGYALSHIDAAADAGADVVKFQTHIANEESTHDEKFRIKFSHQDKTRLDYWKRMEFTPSQWKILKKELTKKILFMSTIHSEKAFNLVNKLDVPAWKVASGEIFSKDLIDKMIKTKKPIIVSTGIATMEEIRKIVKYLKYKKAKFIILQCTSSYPTELNKVGINIMTDIRDKFKCHAGLSDHTGTIFPSLLAAANNASVIEVHVAFDKKMFGPDVSSSVTFEELKFIKDAINNFNYMKKNKINKNNVSNKLKRFKNLFTKSYALKENKKKGYKIKKSDLVLKKPGTGIKKNEIKKLIGKTINKNLSSNRLIKLSDLSQN